MTVPVRDAATVVLVRDGERGVEVWLQRRSSTLVFAADMHAFPGGAVDDEDAAAAVEPAVATRHAAAWGGALTEAVAVAAAAVRETEEECGVVVSAAVLVPWARWVTPEGMPRRFDARFFVAPCPENATPAPSASEVAAGQWWPVVDAVTAHHADRLAMWPPTITTLEQIAVHPTVADVLAAAPRHVERVLG